MIFLTDWGSAIAMAFLLGGCTANLDRAGERCQAQSVETPAALILRPAITPLGLPLAPLLRSWAT